MVKLRPEDGGQVIHLATEFLRIVKDDTSDPRDPPAGQSIWMIGFRR